jgi:hypothetical protein
LPIQTIVDNDMHASFHAEKELMAFFMGVLYAHLGARDSVDDEKTGRNERQCLVDLASYQPSPDVFERWDLMNRYSVDLRINRRQVFVLCPGLWGSGLIDPGRITVDAGGIAADYCIWGNRSRNNRSSTDHGVSTDRNSWENGGIGPDRTTFLKRGFCKAVGPLLAFREKIVCKSRVWANEDVVLHAQAVPELDAAFHRHSISEHDIVLDENMIANVAIFAYDCVR